MGNGAGLLPGRTKNGEIRDFWFFVPEVTVRESEGRAASTRKSSGWLAGAFSLLLDGYCFGYANRR
jgi:hypothetical protein